MERIKEVLSPHERTEAEDKLYGKKDAGTAPPAPPPHAANAMAQGHVQDAAAEAGEVVSAPLELTSGQYIVERDASPMSEEELKKHGTAVGLASATMASGTVGAQNPSQVVDSA